MYLSKLKGGLDLNGKITLCTELQLTGLLQQRIFLENNQKNTSL